MTPRTPTPKRTGTVRARRVVAGVAVLADIGGLELTATEGTWNLGIGFLAVSLALLGISVWIRMSMNESPAFKKMKEEGKTSKAPLTEAFGTWRNLKVVLVALLGAAMMAMRPKVARAETAA